MVSPDIIIRVKSEGDIARQVAMHRQNMLAQALLTDQHVIPLTAAGGQRHPLSRALLEMTSYGMVDNKAARTSTPGGELVQRLERADLRLTDLGRRIEAAQQAGKDINGLSAMQSKTQEGHRRLSKTLEELDEGVRTPKGLPYLYDVPVAPYGLTGWQESCEEREHWILNTLALPATLKQRLNKWLKSNTGSVLPYRYRASLLRYGENDKRPDSDRRLLEDLWAHVQDYREVLTPTKLHMQ